MSEFLKKIVAPISIGLFLLACISTSPTSAPPPSGGNSQSNPPNPSNNGGQAPSSGSGQEYIQLPLSPSVPQSDVIQQITWVGGGAGSDGPSCNSYCFNVYKDRISISYFQPNQQLRIDVFYPTGEVQSGAGVYEFLTEFVVQTDNTGAVEIQLDRNPQYFQYLVLDERGNLIFQPNGIVDKSYSKNTPTCPGNLSSRLSVGKKAQVIPGKTINLQLNPDTNSSNYLVSLDGGTTMNIQAGPQCNEGMVWWQVGAVLSDGIYGGWVAEGNQNTWYVEPLP